MTEVNAKNMEDLETVLLVCQGLQHHLGEQAAHQRHHASPAELKKTLQAK